MNSFFNKKASFKGALSCLIKILSLLLLFCASLLLIGCKEEIRYADYVSELRSNIFLAETENFSLRVYSTIKESPYIADGIPRETNQRTEFYLLAPEGDKQSQLTFSIDGKEYGGEMSFDNVKAEYYLFCPLDTSKFSEISVCIQYGEERIELQAKSVLNADTLPPFTVLSRLQTEEKTLFSALTDKYGFAGEIYIRLLYEDAPYYYVGVIDRSGNVTAFLINATNGKILAKRQS